MEKFLKYDIQIAKNQNKNADLGTFVLKPLEKGFGTTLGNSLRRVILSNIEGHSIFAVKFEDAKHEFQGIAGVKESVTEIILNLKKLVIKIDQDIFGEEEQENTPLEKWPLLKLKKAKGHVKASDIELPIGFSIVNKDLTIAIVDENSKGLTADIYAKTGRGFIPFSDNKELVNSINIVATDSYFSPVTSFSYKVTDIKTSKTKMSESLEITITTNGSISAADSLAMGARILEAHYQPIIKHLNEEFSDLKVINEELVIPSGKSSLSISIDELELSVRSYNCLKRAGIHTITQLTEKTKSEIEKIRNLGKKSYKEILKKIQDRKLKLKEE